MISFQQVIFSHVVAVLDESFVSVLPSDGDAKQFISNLLNDAAPSDSGDFPNVAVDWKERQMCICGSLNDIKTVEVSIPLSKCQ